MTTMEAEVTTTATPATMATMPARWTRGRDRSVWRSARVRILGWYLILLAASTVASLVLVRTLVRREVSERLDRAIAQEIDEFQALAGGVDPRTGRPFGSDVARIADVYFARNVFAEGEAVLVLVDGRPYKSSFGAEYDLSRLDGAVARWAKVREPLRLTVSTPAGEAKTVAVPVLDGDEIQGTFVSAVFPAEERAEVDAAIRLAVVASLSVLVLASAAAWLIAGRVLAPVREVTGTARSLSESDLSRRIEVRGHDEVAELARTFNAMLDRLEAAFSSQQAFLDDAAHELRTPITVVRGHLELLGDDPEEQRATVALVTDELDRMARLVSDLVLLARADRPDFLRLEAVDVGPFTEGLFARAGSVADVPWQLDATGTGRVVADPQRLTQAVMNLVENVARYAPASPAAGLGSAVEAGTVRFWVRDQGPGIPHEERDAIFERFQRGFDPGRSTDGRGLGLSIVRAVAEAHGGRVVVDSEIGVGTTFTIVLPLDPPMEAYPR